VVEAVPFLAWIRFGKIQAKSERSLAPPGGRGHPPLHDLFFHAAI
jgi:hypothetical protein